MEEEIILGRRSTTEPSLCVRDYLILTTALSVVSVLPHQ